MGSGDRIFSQADLSGFPQWVRHMSRCLWIRAHCEQRSKHAGSEIARLLREMEDPVDVATCQALAHFIDPGAQSMRSGPKQDVYSNWVKALEMSQAYGKILSRIGQPGGPRDVTEAKGEACNTLGCCERTLEKFTGGPMRKVVEWAQQGLPPEAVSFEQGIDVCKLFIEKNIKK